MSKYDSIFQPLKIGGMTLSNRIVMVAMGIHTPRLVREDCTYTEEGADYFIERTKGGTGLIVTGALQVQDRFETIGHCVTRVRDSFIKNSQYLLDGVHSNGGKIVAQLSAGSGRTAPYWLIKNAVIAPSDGLPNVWKPDFKHRALTHEEIKFYIASFADAAEIVKLAGYDGVELHAIHEGYLMDQFTMECTNHRTDEYGGSLENRLRFPCEIIAAIKERCGEDFPVMVRYSVRSMMKGFNQGALPGETFKEFGRDLEESKKVAKLLEEAGADALDADNGSYDSWWWAHPPVYMPKACNLEDCAAIKKEVSIPVICAGRFDNPDLVAESIADGRVDAVGMARPLLADPQWGNKVRKGEVDDIRPCISCHAGCLARIFEGKDMCCALNPTVGREKAYAIRPAEQKKKILVIGGGIAGMEAARVSALRGHSVILCERKDKLGGVFVAAAAPEFKEDEKRLLAWYPKQLKNLGVEIRLGCEVTPELIEAVRPDEIFLATGASAKQLRIPGMTDNNTMTAVEALLGQKNPGKNVVVVGGGLTGCEIAYEFSKHGKKVAVVELQKDILTVPGLSAANRNMLLHMLPAAHIDVYKESKLAEIRTSTALVDTPSGRQEIPADSVVLSVGYNCDTELYSKIKDMKVPIHNIGDSNKVSNLLDAVWGSYEAAMQV